MPLSARDLTALKGAGIIDDQTAERIEDFFATSAALPFRLDLTHGAYLLGTLVVLWAMGWFAIEAQDRYGWGVLTVTAVAYAVIFFFAANTLWRKPGLRLPGGCLYLIAAGMIPLTVFSLLNVLGIWPAPLPDLPDEEMADLVAEFFRAFRMPRIVVELSAIGTLLAVMRKRPFGLLAAGVAYALWGMSIDLAVLLSDPAAGYLPEAVNKEITFFFGLTVLGITFMIDRRTREDYAMWLYLSGLVAAWGALTVDNVGSWYYATFNLGAMLAAVLLERTAFMVFGILGIFTYLAWLAGEVFGDSVVFPLALVAIGVAIIAGGVWYRNNRERVDAALIATIPARLREVLPRYREQT